MMEKTTEYNPCTPSESYVTFVTVLPCGSFAKYVIGNRLILLNALLRISKVNFIEAWVKLMCCKNLVIIITKDTTAYIISRYTMVAWDPLKKEPIPSTDKSSVTTVLVSPVSSLNTVNEFASSRSSNCSCGVNTPFINTYVASSSK